MLSNYTIKMQFKGVLHSEMPDILFFFNIKIFLQFKFQICAYTQLKSKIKKKNFNFKNSQGGCATPPNVPKLGVSGVKDTAKTNKECGMLCCILLEYSVFLHWHLSLWPCKNYFQKYF